MSKPDTYQIIGLYTMHNFSAPLKSFLKLVITLSKLQTFEHIWYSSTLLFYCRCLPASPRKRTVSVPCCCLVGGPTSCLRCLPYQRQKCDDLWLLVPHVSHTSASTATRKAGFQFISIRQCIIIQRCASETCGGKTFETVVSAWNVQYYEFDS
jgi:hypothetical protein